MINYSQFKSSVSSNPQNLITEKTTVTNFLQDTQNLFHNCCNKSALFTSLEPTIILKKRPLESLDSYKVSSIEKDTNKLRMIRIQKVTDYPYTDGSYSGDIHNKNPHGKGVYKLNDGRIYEGKWQNGSMFYGKLTYPTNPDPDNLNNWYEYTQIIGEFVNSIPHGYVKCYLVDNKVYIGDMKHGLRDGYGMMKWSDGSCYVGEWRDNEQNGRGKFFSTVQNYSYYGNCSNGKFDGDGVMAYANGEVYRTKYQQGESVSSTIIDLKNIPINEPEIDGLKATLQPHQIKGYHFLSTLLDHGINVCLADDMGLGKTVQVISLLLKHAHKGPSLIISPAVVCSNWKKELKNFAPSLTVLMINTSYSLEQREQIINDCDVNQVIICSYKLLTNHLPKLKRKKWNILALDEAHNIKNPSTNNFKSSKKLLAEHKIAITGTPLENRLSELWSIMNFTNPWVLGSAENFRKSFITKIEDGTKDCKKLKQLVEPYILRRTKEILDLPPLIIEKIFIKASSEEKEILELIRIEAFKEIKETKETISLNDIAEEDHSPVKSKVLAKIMNLRLGCCHLSLIKHNYSKNSYPIETTGSKLNKLINVISGLVINNHKILVFSQFTSFLNLVKQRLNNEKINYHYMDGSTSAAKRDAEIESFQSTAGGHQVFLLSLKTANAGITLTAADRVIMVEPGWNPAMEDQAIGRAHRIGQNNLVKVYRLILNPSIEEELMKIHQNKQELFENIMSDYQDLDDEKIYKPQLVGLLSRSYLNSTNDDA